MSLQETSFKTFSLVYEEKNLLILNKKEKKEVGKVH